MRQKLQKMIFFIFIFQMEERVLYFFPYHIMCGVFDVYEVKKKLFDKIPNIKITIDEYVPGANTFKTDISTYLFFIYQQ